VAATDGVGAGRIEIVVERGLPMRRSFVLDWWLNHGLVRRGSARRFGLSHSFIHRWRYLTRVMAGLKRDWRWCALPRLPPPAGQAFAAAAAEAERMRS